MATQYPSREVSQIETEVKSWRKGTFRILKAALVQAARDEETLNGVRYQLVVAERRSDRLAGHRAKDESEALNATIRRLGEVLQNAKANSQMLTLQIASSLKELGGSSLSKSCHF